MHGTPIVILNDSDKLRLFLSPGSLCLSLPFPPSFYKPLPMSFSSLPSPPNPSPSLSLSLWYGKSNLLVHKTSVFQCEDITIFSYWFKNLCGGWGLRICILRHECRILLAEWVAKCCLWSIKKKLHCPLDFLPDVSLSQILPNVSGPRHKRKPFWITRCQPQVLIGPKSQIHFCCVLHVRRIFTKISSI